MASMQPQNKLERAPPSAAAAPRRVKLAGIYEVSVYVVTAGIAISGIVWLLLHYYGQIQGEFGVQTNPYEPWSLKIHGAFSALALVLVGSLLAIHVTPALQSRRHLITGLSLLGIWLLLAVTGYLLYYAGDEDLRALISKLHWIVGLVLPLLLIAHLCERFMRRAWRRRQTTR
jgi:hypothetical protein